MLRRIRLGAVLMNAILVATAFLVLAVPPAAATPGRNSPATAEDCGAGLFESIYYTDANSIGPNYINAGPPVEEDYFKCSVWQGQVFQAVLWAGPGVTVTVQRSVGGNLVDLASDAAGQTVNIGGVGPLSLASITMVIYRTETLYIKVSPPAGAASGDNYYNLYMRAYNATVLGAGDSLTTTPNGDSIFGWDYFSAYGFRHTDDFYWVNASDAPGSNHQNYRLTLTADCSTAMYDLFLYQYLDYPSERLDLVNHSFAMERRLNRAASTTASNVLDFAPVYYDGRYLLRVHAAENGSFSIGTADRYTYTLGVSTLGGFAKDGNDRLGDGPLVTISGTGAATGTIDQRDDSVDWVRLQLLEGDVVGMGLQFTRPNSEITTLGLRYRVLVFAPNGTIMADDDNWGVSGGNLFFNPYITVQSFTAGEAGVYHVGIFTTDGALNYIDPHLINTGGVGRNSAGWTLNVQLPNRPPYVNASSPPPEGIVFNEDGEFRFSMVGSFIDPEGKSLSYGPVQYSSNLTVTIGSGVVTVRSIPDWFGSDSFTVTVKDDDLRNNQQVRINVTVLPVNDVPRVHPGAANYSVIQIDEDGSATVPLRSIFFDVDDTSLEFTAGGITTTKADVLINNVSQVATITPDLNWNGEFEVTWTATDGAGLLRDFTSLVRVREVNDPPKATDTRLPRIVIDEGQDYFINLSGHFFDFDFEDGDYLRYYGAVDPSVADFIRVNNTQLDPTDPNMRVYVLDQYRSNYFTNGPIPIKFWVLDSSNNVDGKNGIPVVVEKTTFLEIVNVNDAPIVDEIQPAPSEVAINEYREGDSITFAVTRVVDPDNTFFPDTDTQFFYKWYVNGVEILGQTTQTFVFRTVQDATQPGQWDEGDYVVTVQVFDAAGAQAQQEPEWEFTVKKTNRQPSIQVIRPTQYTFEEGTPIQFQALVSDEDPEDSNLTITWKYLDARGNEVVVGTDEQFTSHLEPGTYTVIVTVSDGIQTVQREVQLTVTEHKLNTPGFEGLFGALAMAAVALAAAGARRPRRPA